LLGVLGVLLVIVMARRDLPPVPAPSPTATEAFLPVFAGNDFGSLRIASSTGSSVSLVREDGQWFLVEPGGLPGDPARLAAVSSWLSSMTVIATLDGEVDPRELGLAPPVHLLTLGAVDGSTVEIHLGDATPTGGGTYARLTDGPILVLSQAAVAPLLDLLANPPVLEPAPTPEA
jgi:hypothetical protein